MSHIVSQRSHLQSVNQSRSFELFIGIVAAAALTLGLFADALAVNLQQNRSTRRPTVTRRQPTTQRSSPVNSDDALPENPVIVAESRRLAAQKLEEQQKYELELLAKNIS